MKYPTSNQYACIHIALKALQWDERVKEELVISYTGDPAKKSLKDLSYEQASDLIAFLNAQITPSVAKPHSNKKLDKISADKIRKRIIAICHNMGWYRRDENRRLILVPAPDGALDGWKKLIDYDHLDNYLLTRSAAKKKLNEMNVAELNAAAVQLNRYYLTTLKAK